MRDAENDNGTRSERKRGPSIPAERHSPQQQRVRTTKALMKYFSVLTNMPSIKENRIVRSKELKEKRIEPQ